MISTVRRSSTVVLALLAMLMLFAAPSFAQYPPAQANNGASSQPENPRPGDIVTVTSGGFMPGSSVNYTVTDSTGAVITSGTTTADADGNVSFTYQVPTDAPDGRSYGSVLSGTATNGSPYTTSDISTVAPAPPGELPSTGSSSMTLGIIAGAVLLGGGLLVVAGRKKNDTKVDATV